MSTLPQRLGAFFRTPIHIFPQWLMISIISLLFIFAPLLGDDWLLNTTGLEYGLDLYQANPDYVYPPWSLILLWPYRWLGGALTRVLIGLFTGLWVWWTGQSLSRFLAIVVSAYFVFTLGFNNIDLFVTVLPIFLWYAGDHTRWEIPARTAALLLLSLKPQSGLLLAAVLVWHFRHEWRRFILPAFLTALVIVIPSLLGSPPLFLQWLDNLVEPSAINTARWLANNVSFTVTAGFPLAAFITLVLIAGFLLLFRRRQRSLTRFHVYAVVLLVSVLLSPYASHQSMVGFVVLVPSWPAVLLQYAVVILLLQLGTYQASAGFWTLLFGLSYLWFFKSPAFPLPDSRLPQQEASAGK